MAIARYKAVKEFTYQDVEYKLGYQLILDTDEAKALVETGKMLFVVYLDPEDPKDASVIAHFTNNPTGQRRQPAPAPEAEGVVVRDRVGMKRGHKEAPPTGEAS